MLAGVYLAKKKDNTIYYRSSITYKNKHISLGSYVTEEDAHMAYLEAGKIIEDLSISIISYSSKKNILSFEKWICLLNFRDNNIYIKTPIYIRKNYFSYFYSPKIELKFDFDDLFYYSSHKIMKRQGHLFVSDYGMQVNILSRYGIKNYSVIGRDYTFANKDCYDFRYENIIIINQYYGVEKKSKNSCDIFISKIHLNGNIIIGNYSSEIHAAIAYNKAVDVLKSQGIDRNYQINYIENLSAREYAEIYSQISISPKLYNLK